MTRVPFGSAEALGIATNATTVKMTSNANTFLTNGILMVHPPLKDLTIEKNSFFDASSSHSENCASM
jgi:hypothetical protein